MTYPQPGQGPSAPTNPYPQQPPHNPPQPPANPLPPPGTPGAPHRAASVAIATLALCLFAVEAMAAGAGGGSMPYSSWLTTFRNSVSGEVAMTISLVCVVAGVAGWVAGGELTGMLMYIVRAVCGLAIVLGAVAFLGTIGTSGAVMSHLPLIASAH